MIYSPLFENDVIKITASKDILTRIFGTSLKSLIDNIDVIINDPTLNRLMRELNFDTQKGMCASVTTGYGTSAGYYIIKAETVVNIIKRQIDEKHEDIKYEQSKKSKQTTGLIERYKSVIASLTIYLNYFTEKAGQYFIINGQHRFDSIKQDYLGILEPKNKKKTTKAEYSNLKVEINGEVYNETVTSYYELKQKLCSAGEWLLYDFAKNLSYDERKTIFQSYLESCQLCVIEIVDSIDFSSIMTYVKRSNQSAGWDDFAFEAIQSFSAYSTWFRDNLMPERTNDLNKYEKLFYTKTTPLSISKGTFKRNDGGWQYFIGVLMATIYSQPHSINRFEVKTKPDICKILFKDDSPFIKEWGEKLLSDMVKVMAAISEINNQPNAKVFKKTYEKASFFIYCMFALNYYRNNYVYSHGRDKWKLDVKDSNIYEFIHSILMVCFIESKITHPQNTNYWQTEDGKDQIEFWKSKKAFDFTKNPHHLSAKDLTKEYQNDWADIEKKCEKNETKDIEKSFGRHFIGDLLTWGHDHSCVINVFNKHIEQAFQTTMVDMKTSKHPFCEIGFISCSELPTVSKLVSSDFDELVNLLGSTEETDRAHNKARAKGGSSAVSNIELSDRVINRKQKDVV